MTELENNLHESLRLALEEREKLKLTATKLIEHAYKGAERVKASPLSYNSAAEQGMQETNVLTFVKGLREMAVALEVLTKEESDTIEKEYWENRDKIPLNIPDRF